MTLVNSFRHGHKGALQRAEVIERCEARVGQWLCVGTTARGFDKLG